VALRAAQVLGCDLGYMGTRFIATRESLAPDAYRAMLVTSSIDDVLLTRAFTGLPTSMLVPSIRQAGLDPATLDETVTPNSAAQMFGGSSHGHASEGPRRWRDIWSAGHSVSGVQQVQTVEAMVAQIEQEFHKAIA
jgi:nitronate monooxygenase